MSLLHGRTDGLSHIVNRSNYGIGISVKPEMEQRSVNNFFKRGKGDLQVELLERDDESATFQVTMDSKTLDEPITAQIETRIDGLRSIDNPMETVNQSTSFFLDASNDIFNKSRGRLAELYPNHKPDLEGFDFTKMEAVAMKVHDQIGNVLTYGCDIANNLDKEQDKTPRAKKDKSLSFAM